MSRFQLLLDENVDFALRVAMRRRRGEVVVWVIGDPGAPGRGTLDPDILNWCEATGFLLVTNNRASMPVHLSAHLAAGRHAPGILVLHAGMTVGQIVDELDLICGASEPAEYRDALHYLPVSR